MENRYIKNNQIWILLQSNIIFPGQNKKAPNALENYIIPNTNNPKNKLENNNVQ